MKTQAWGFADSVTVGPLCNVTVTWPSCLLAQGLEHVTCVHIVMLALGVCVDDDGACVYVCVGGEEIQFWGN